MEKGGERFVKWGERDVGREGGVERERDVNDFFGDRDENKWERFRDFWKG